MPNVVGNVGIVEQPDAFQQGPSALLEPALELLFLIVVAHAHSHQALPHFAGGVVG